MSPNTAVRRIRKSGPEGPYLELENNLQASSQWGIFPANLPWRRPRNENGSRPARSRRDYHGNARFFSWRRYESIFWTLRDNSRRDGAEPRGSALTGALGRPQSIRRLTLNHCIKRPV